jgi:sulfate permease, SulP family
MIHTFIATAGMSMVEAQASGWLLSLHTDVSLFVPLFDPQQVAAALPAVAANSGEIVAVAVVTAMAVILNTSGLEVLWKKDSDLEREFRVTGIANILSGSLGGIAGNISLNRSTLNPGFPIWAPEKCLPNPKAPPGEGGPRQLGLEPRGRCATASTP